jgi:4-hydroxyphenylpyruvate dioxygenase
MTNLAPLGIKRLEALHYYVNDLERSRRFYTEMFGMAQIGQSAPELERTGKQRSAIFQAGDITFVCSMPIGVGGRAWRYLRKHPDGVGSIVFEVEEIDRTFRLLEERGGTAITDIHRFEDDGGSLAMFNITTPFGDTTFRFVERRGFRSLYSGVVATPAPAPTAPLNPYGLRRIDHVTSNFQTMKPALLWMEHVMGFEQYWEVEFHTTDVNPDSKGSGLKSIVMFDRASGVKFANNEPQRPFFKASQINIFNEELRGDGIQHVALECDDILSTVEQLRGKGVSFMPTPGSYYEMLDEHLARTRVGKIDEDVANLRRLEVLVDGEGPGAYMLQIFLKENAQIFGDPSGGPFFFEIIQRKGDRGFGAGNFRALFESIEREQKQAGKV